ncbi:MAG: carotenoid oxygenase family protein [Nocardia sp.]|nr:carotenoid oxygenase family protein [Nocardia sp.]
MGNQFLEGAFAPISREYTLTDLRVTGSIPDHLDGRYLRNGPNPVGELDPALYNWFIGDGMVHGVRLREGCAEWYRNRWVRGPVTAKALGERPRHALEGAWGPGANTNVIGHAGRTLALIEAGQPNYELSEELDTIGVCDFDGTLPGGYTAHPKRDPKTGELHAVSYSFLRGNKIQYSVIGVDGRARRTVDIEVSGSPMMHDFSLTENHVILYDLPVTFDTRQAAQMSVPGPLRLPARLMMSALIGRVPIPSPPGSRGTEVTRDRRLPYRWNPGYPARIGVMPRTGGNADVRWFDIDPCYVFHPMNAYEDGDTIALDLVRYDRVFDADLLGPLESPPSLEHWEIDLNAGKVRQERRDDRPQEFPRVDERRTGRRHRYGYAAGIGDTEEGSVLFRHDLVRGDSSVRSFGNGKVVGEFVFEPSSADAAEDDGVLMGLVTDPAAGTTDLAILDAATLEDVARVHLPHRIPVGFHGNWVPSA